MSVDIRRHIDAARQILVGVVPNPTSQIDQITNALIYKFMDDMDQSAIKAGGKPSFFIDDLEHYSWARLMDSRMGNQERMNLYSEALLKFSQAKQLPDLFRNIFKSAFLPYRSPETLGLFLKEIDYFDYSHPEELGNAYEYLLSIMSSQGDAGQFRTPRHIIDFIVDVVNPTKDDKVLDPACGTAGFLISSYKHILEQHDGKDDPKKKEKRLLPNERKKLMANFEGYDIDPTMVRIAQVNMYLHQFKDPKIFQYDSLSSEERWNDKFDVILANPPFMSPKGGIRPHNKFSISSSRSEVLFVDYIMNHLRPKGRAGIIVPEGIIFQSGISHKQLRKNLVEDGLCAVVSLPSGVFAPYSGVKTSILLFNNELAKAKDEVLFIRVENDGFDLGAQRRVITKNDLPTALEIIKKWDVGEKVENKLAVYAAKSEIAKNGDYNLSGERYKKEPLSALQQLLDDTQCQVELYSKALEPMRKMTEEYAKAMKALSRPAEDIQKMIDSPFFKSYAEDVQRAIESIQKAFNENNFRQVVENIKFIKTQQIQKWPMLKLGEICKITTGKKDVNEGNPSGEYPFFTCAREHTFIDSYSFNTEALLIAGNGDVGVVKYYKGKFDAYQRTYVLSDFKKVNAKYLYQILNNSLRENLRLQKLGNTMPYIKLGMLQTFKIPLPPIEIQEQIVAELDGYQNIVDGAKQVVQNWKPKIDIDSEWEKVKLGDIGKISMCKRIFKEQTSVEGDIPFYKISTFGKAPDAFISRKIFNDFKAKFSYPKKGEILISTSGTIGRTVIFDGEPAYFQDSNIVWIENDEKKVYNNYLNLVFQDIDWITIKGGTIERLYNKLIEEQVISIPPIDTQKEIVGKIEAERVLIESSKKLIEIYEQKIKDAIDKFWKE